MADGDAQDLSPLWVDLQQLKLQQLPAAERFRSRPFRRNAADLGKVVLATLCVDVVDYPISGKEKFRWFIPLQGIDPGG